MTFSKLLNESKDESPRTFSPTSATPPPVRASPSTLKSSVSESSGRFHFGRRSSETFWLFCRCCANKHLQTVTNFFIVNLAIADLLLSIIVLPFLRVSGGAGMLGVRSDLLQHLGSGGCALLHGVYFKFVHYIYRQVHRGKTLPEIPHYHD